MFCFVLGVEWEEWEGFEQGSEDLPYIFNRTTLAAGRKTGCSEAKVGLGRPRREGRMAWTRVGTMGMVIRDWVLFHFEGADISICQWIGLWV